MDGNAVWSAPVLWAAGVGFLVGVLLGSTVILVVKRARRHRSDLSVPETQPQASDMDLWSGYGRWIGKFVILMQQAALIAATSSDPELVSKGQYLHGVQAGYRDWLPTMQILGWPTEESAIARDSRHFSYIQQILLSKAAPTPSVVDAAESNWDQTSFTLFDVHEALKEEYFKHVRSAVTMLAPR